MTNLQRFYLVLELHGAWILAAAIFLFIIHKQTAKHRMLRDLGRGKQVKPIDWGIVRRTVYTYAGAGIGVALLYYLFWWMVGLAAFVIGLSICAARFGTIMAKEEKEFWEREIGTGYTG